MLTHLQHNIAGGFDQERFGASIGFGNLKRCLLRSYLLAPSSRLLQTEHVGMQVHCSSGSVVLFEPLEV